MSNAKPYSKGSLKSSDSDNLVKVLAIAYLNIDATSVIADKLCVIANKYGYLISIKNKTRSY